MMEAQGCLCAACDTSLLLSGCDIDHDHSTGKVRALLCPRCNALLGGNTVASLRRFIAYLERCTPEQE